MNKSSLTKRLFFRISPILVTMIGVIGFFAFKSADKEINKFYDVQLINNANVLAALFQEELHEAQNDITDNNLDAELGNELDVVELNFSDQLINIEDLQNYANARMLRVWDDNKIIVYSDTALPITSVPKSKTGFSNITYQNEEWRIYSIAVPNSTIFIEIGEEIALRNRLAENIIWDLGLPLLTLIPLLGILVWVSIGNGLATIRTLVKQIRSRSPDDLSPIVIKTLPTDLLPLGLSINQLLKKLDLSLTAERRFTDHAAHQLRTPLASLRLQLQMLSKADSKEQYQSIITDLLESNARASRMISQLLSAARARHQPIHMQPVNLDKIVSSLLLELAPLLNQKHILCTFHKVPHAHVIADEPLLRLMFFNILENAVKYTDVGGEITINISPQEKICLISITDSGPGIPTEQRQLVFHHFYRVNRPQQAEGTGLGLAIVADILERLNGKIFLKTPDAGKGLLVEILLPKID